MKLVKLNKLIINLERQVNKMEQSNNNQKKQGGSSKPADASKLWGILGYIFPILFFVPLIMDDLKTNAYSKFHANQQLVLLLAAIAVNIVGSIIPVLGWFIILPFGSIALIVLAIMGIVNAAKGEQKPLPMIGKIEILK